MKILFKKTGKPYTPDQIEKCVTNFGSGYNKTVLRVTEASRNGMDRAVFFASAAILMPNFLMTRAGPFKGVKFVDGTVKDPKGQIAACWNENETRGSHLKYKIFERQRSLLDEGICRRYNEIGVASLILRNGA